MCCRRIWKATAYRTLCSPATVFVSSCLTGSPATRLQATAPPSSAPAMCATVPSRSPALAHRQAYIYGSWARFVTYLTVLLLMITLSDCAPHRPPSRHLKQCTVNLTCSGRVKVLRTPLNKSATDIHLVCTKFYVNVDCRTAAPVSFGMVLGISSLLILIPALVWLYFPPPAKMETPKKSWRRSSMSKMSIIYILSALISVADARCVTATAMRYQWLCIANITSPGTCVFRGQSFTEFPLELKLDHHLAQQSMLCACGSQQPQEVYLSTLCGYPPPPLTIFTDCLQTYATFLCCVVAFTLCSSLRAPAFLTTLPVVLAETPVRDQRESNLPLYLFLCILLAMLLNARKPANTLWMLGLSMGVFEGASAIRHITAE